MDNCFDQPCYSEETYQDIEHIEVKEELVDTDEMFNIQEDNECRQSQTVDNQFNSINTVPMKNISIKEDQKKNSEQTKEVNKESFSQKSRVECSRSSSISKAATKHPQKRHQQIGSRSFLKARRPRLGYCGRYDAFGLYVAKKLENLPDKMAIFAQKMISDVLFEAEMGSLNRNSKVEALPSLSRVKDLFDKR